MHSSTHQRALESRKRSSSKPPQLSLLFRACLQERKRMRWSAELPRTREKAIFGIDDHSQHLPWTITKQRLHGACRAGSSASLTSSGSP